MNREILFRGKAANANKWVYGFLVAGLSGSFWIMEKYNSLGPPYDAQDEKPVLASPKTVGQYTGLKDKNGKIIFEGDRVKYGEEELIVVYQAPSFIMKKNKRAKTWQSFILAPCENQIQEIIGNIHEEE